MIGQVLTELEIEGESCLQALEAVEKVSARPFQLVIIDWSSQPEAGFLLNTARDRKPADRPLTLAIVSDDGSVPTALQAGANSVLRKPLLVNQVKDTLATARDLLRAKREPPTTAASAAAAASSAAASAMLPMEVQSTLHAGEFLQPSGSAPSPQFETESSDVQKSMDQAAASQIDPLKDLEPTAAAPISQAPTARTQRAPDSIADDEPRGLAWYLKTRAKSQPADAPEPEPAPAPPDKAQLLSYDRMPSHSQPAREESPAIPEAEPTEPHLDSPRSDPQGREEAVLFAYITGDKPDPEKEPSKPRPWLKKLVIAAAVGVAAAGAYFMVPQAVVKKDLKAAVGKATHAGHTWLNPQPATPTQVQAHESFGRAGDEYKLPVAENIPDANTDPSQIRVLPVVDPTAKQANNGTANPGQSAAAANTATPGVTDPTQIDPKQIDPKQGDPTQTDPNQAPAGQTPPGLFAGQTPNGQVPPTQATPDQAAQNPNQIPANQPPQNAVQPNQASARPAQNMPQTAIAPPSQPPAAGTSAASGSVPALVTKTTAAPTISPAVQTAQSAPAIQPLRSASYPAVSSGNASTPGASAIPSSLRSSLAQMSPDASGNKPPEAALPSIEPVNLPEAAARGLLLQGPAPAYPPSARGTSGSVVLQVLIGRDGNVQDAKFLQGSLAFARPAIDAVKQWRFKPYLMNGRPASTQTLLTLGFKPGS